MNITKKTTPKPEYVLDRSFEEEDKDPHELHSPLPELSLSQIIESIGVGRFHYIMIFVVSLNFLSISFQYILPGLMLPTFFKEFELGSFELSIYGFCEYSGYLTGSLLSYFLSERFGRRKTILVTLIFSAIIIALCCLAQSIFVIILLRFLAINALVINYYYTYAFMLELLPPKTKKNLTIYIQIMNSLGPVLCILLVSWVFESLDYGNWQLIMIISSILIWIAFSLNAMILDESPYYNMKKGNSEAAYLVINKIAKFNIKNPEFLNLEKKRMISSWFIKNESNFNLMKKSQTNVNVFEDKFNLGLMIIWAVDMFIFHGFDFILPIFLVLQKNAIDPLYQKHELLDYLTIMHVVSCSYIILVFCVERINFRRKIFVLFLQLAGAVVSLFMGLNMPPSFFFWMVVFKLLINLYSFFKMQILCQRNNEKTLGVNLKTVKIYGKIGMVTSTFLLVFFLNLNIYVIYFIFSGLCCVNIFVWPNVQNNNGEIREEIEKNELNKPLNNFNGGQDGFDNIYRIIEIPL